MPSLLLPLVVVDENDRFSSDASTTDRWERTRAKERILNERLVFVESTGETERVRRGW